MLCSTNIIWQIGIRQQICSPSRYDWIQTWLLSRDVPRICEQVVTIESSQKICIWGMAACRPLQGLPGYTSCHCNCITDRVPVVEEYFDNGFITLHSVSTTNIEHRWNYIAHINLIKWIFANVNIYIKMPSDHSSSNCWLSYTLTFNMTWPMAHVLLADSNCSCLEIEIECGSWLLKLFIFVKAIHKNCNYSFCIPLIKINSGFMQSEANTTWNRRIAMVTSQLKLYIYWVRRVLFLKKLYSIKIKRRYKNKQTNKKAQRNCMCTMWIVLQTELINRRTTFMNVKVLLQWNSTSVYTSCTYSTYHLELALGTFICHFISACLVCHTS